MDDFESDKATGVKHEILDANKPLKLLTSSSIVGDQVYNRSNEHLGTIKEIMLNTTTGIVEYYVMESGGILGTGAKNFIMPFRLLKYDRKNKRFIYTKSKESIANSPGFDIGHWPNTNVHIRKLSTYWNFFR